MSIFTIFISALLVNNFVLSRFLGICPFLGVSKKVETSAGMGAAVTFVMVLAAMMTFLVERFILIPLGLSYLSTLAFILVIASLVQFVEMVIKKMSPDLYKSLGIFLPLITTNCAVLGMALINSQEQYTFIQSIVNSVGAALGFTLALVLLAGIREKFETNEYIPEPLRGLPITLITAGIMAIAFLGFQGLI
ncbi:MULTISPECIES: electron transport complex subunit RsxA [Clostridium]|uniref:electron transport complex subunit RsxA n=1 Tax=Clostridium TaxID=1485 RepID=UPI001647AAD3|nr:MULTISPECIES: electron transport complex subunit RsxA [Clostridium]MBM7871057.1 electron transport complex protein RnfA [Clostridium pascui]